MEFEPRWGSAAIDLTAHDLPALKASFLLRHLPRRGVVLELGSGEGKLLRTLRRQRPELRLIGCDVRDVSPVDGAYEFRRIVSALPAADGELDAAFFVDVLEHLDDPERALAGLYRALKPGGLLVGFGSRMGSGCTSGHGVVGLARLSRRSIAAVATFMAAAIVTVFVMGLLG